MSKKTLILFGEKVKKEKIKQYLSQKELAKRAGIHRTYIGRLRELEKSSKQAP